MAKMVRVLVLSGVLAVGQVPPAVAGELLESATRIAQEAGRLAPASVVASRTPARGQFAAAEQGSLAESGMSKRKKWLIVLVAAVGVAGGIYAIDHGVEDNTPSTKGTRKD